MNTTKGQDPNKKGDQKMIEVYVQAITEMGCVVYTEVRVPEDYTMNQMVNEIKRLGFKQFRIVETMNKFVKVA